MLFCIPLYALCCVLFTRLYVYVIEYLSLRDFFSICCAAFVQSTQSYDRQNAVSITFSIICTTVGHIVGCYCLSLLMFIYNRSDVVRRRSRYARSLGFVSSMNPESEDCARGLIVWIFGLCFVYFIVRK